MRQVGHSQRSHIQNVTLDRQYTFGSKATLKKMRKLKNLSRSLRRVSWQFQSWMRSLKSLKNSENPDSKKQQATTRQGMMRMRACLLSGLSVEKKSLSCQNSVLDFFEPETRSSSSVLLESGDDDPSDPRPRESSLYLTCDLFVIRNVNISLVWIYRQFHNVLRECKHL